MLFAASVKRQRYPLRIVPCKKGNHAHHTFENLPGS
jgi:hypothetical protein